MDIFRRRQDNRRNKPRPVGRLAAFFHGFVNVVFYCILNDAAVKHDGIQIIANEPSAISSNVTSAKSPKKEFDTNTNGQIHQRRTNHDPKDSNSLSKPSLSRAHSPSSVGCLGKEKRNEQEKKTASLKGTTFSWLRKERKTRNTKEQRCDVDTSQPASPVVTCATKAQNCQSSSSFKILKLLASPGGARKGIPSFNPEPFPSVPRTSESSILSLGSIDVSILSGSQTSTSASHMVPDLYHYFHTTLDTSNKTSDCNTTAVCGIKLVVHSALNSHDPVLCGGAAIPDIMSVGDEISANKSVSDKNEMTAEDGLLESPTSEADKSPSSSDATPAESDGIQDGGEMP